MRLLTLIAALGLPSAQATTLDQLTESRASFAEPHLAASASLKLFDGSNAKPAAGGAPVAAASSAGASRLAAAAPGAAVKTGSVPTPGERFIQLERDIDSHRSGESFGCFVATVGGVIGIAGAGSFNPAVMGIGALIVVAGTAWGLHQADRARELEQEKARLLNGILNRN